MAFVAPVAIWNRHIPTGRKPNGAMCGGFGEVCSDLTKQADIRASGKCQQLVRAPHAPQPLPWCPKLRFDRPSTSTHSDGCEDRMCRSCGQSGTGTRRDLWESFGGAEAEANVCTDLGDSVWGPRARSPLKLDPHRADCHSSIWHLPVALEGTTSMDGLMEGTWHLQRWEALNSPSRRSQRRAPGTATPHAQVELAQSRGSCP